MEKIVGKNMKRYLILIITSLILLTIPYQTTTCAAPISLIEIWEAKKLKKQDIKEYFEFYFNEIRGYEETHFLWIKGLNVYITSKENFNNKNKLNYYVVVFSGYYFIINDPLILNKKINRKYGEELKEEYNRYKRENKRIVLT